MRDPLTSGVRRVVTGHDSTGRSIFQWDDEVEPVLVSRGEAAMALIWTTATMPADNNDETDGRDREVGVTLPGGSVLRVVDLLPGQESPMHRTSSVDYGIVLSGRVVLELDDGVTTELYPGDVLVQRGTMHLWRNPSDVEPCRMVFVLLDAAPVRIDGTELRDASS